VNESSEEFRAKIKSILANAPTSPGVYLMEGHDGDIFYVGKANNIRQRLRSYFQTNPGDSRYFVSILEKLLVDISFVLTTNEKEALILENELIKQYHPKYNVLFRDDKNYLHIRVDTSKPFPRLETVRRRANDQALYFGPYDSSGSLRNTLNIVNKHFGLRTCTDHEFRTRTRPCIEHQIGRCPAPCVLELPANSYERSVHDATLFLEGRCRDLVDRLKQRMTEASSQTLFERAAHYRDQIQAITRSLTRQNVVLKRAENLDVIAFATEDNRALVQVTRYRDGYPVGNRRYQMPASSIEHPDSALTTFLHTLYERRQDTPPLILINRSISMQKALTDVLSDRAGRNVALRCPQRGQKRALIRAAERNALQHLKQSTAQDLKRLDTLAQCQSLLNLKNLPVRIETYDISNIQGSDAVGSMVVFTDGKPDRAGYRHFGVKTISGIDDFAMMAEMLVRRFNDGETLGPLPDLVILDGGKAHLRAVIEALERAGHIDLEIVALAKERVKKQRDDEPGKLQDLSLRPERVYLRNAKDPIPLHRATAVMHLMAMMRNEAHRTAINFHRKRRRRRTVRSELDGIKGVGPKRRTLLLREFGSVQELRRQSAATVTERTGIPMALAKTILTTLSRQEDV
tara:strand:- start:1706 stop:3595 length:1890 start_codon:yes stop_codon:yes gene_type:complete